VIDISILKPIESSRGNGTLLYEVNNRGNIAILRQLHEASFSNDPATVADRATFTDPFQYPIGIPTVIVNGRVVLDEGRHTGERPGIAPETVEQ
jgi:N-acyl-D-aspartate/D-glutamate deacylase